MIVLGPIVIAVLVLAILFPGLARAVIIGAICVIVWDLGEDWARGVRCGPGVTPMDWPWQAAPQPQASAAPPMITREDYRRHQ